MEHEVEVSAVVRAAPARVREVFVDDLESVLAGRRSAEPRHSRLFLCELTVYLGSGSSLHQEVLVQAGAAQVAGGLLVVPIQLHASGRERLFPSFQGELAVLPDPSGTRIGMSGHCRVPLGRLGGFGESLMRGEQVAEESLAHYVEAVARRAADEVDRRVASPSRAPGSHSSDDRSEHYIG
jgi:hypothetical protein